MTTTFKMPKPFIYAHELIENKGGVWLGVAEKGICEQAHTPGETGEEVVALYTAQSLREILEQAAQIAGREYENFFNTKQAHYRLSPAPFVPANFGFNMDVVNKSEDAMLAIRAMIGEIK